MTCTITCAGGWEPQTGFRPPIFRMESRHWMRCRTCWTRYSRPGPTCRQKCAPRQGISAPPLAPRRPEMFDGADTVVLYEELAFQDVLPVVWRQMPNSADRDMAAGFSERNLQVLQA